MSIVPKETIEVIAQSIGITNLSQDVALALAPDVEHRVRHIMQEAIKCMCHSKRTVLTADDVDSALNLRNVEPIYGFASGDPLRFKRAVDHKDLFYIDDKDVEFRDLIEAPLPKAPLDTAIVVHWLAIEGVQPAIPENAPVEAPTATPDDKKSDHSKEDELPVDVKLPVKHVLSRELQLYFDKFTELVVSKSESNLFKEALRGLARDSGLHPLVPYFTHFIADEVSQSLNDLPVLFALMRAVYGLLRNPHIHIEPYLHQLMPSVITCIVAKRLGHRFVDNHWELRDFTAKLVASICRRFGYVYHTLQTRVTRTLLNAFLDPKKSMTQHYGAIQGFAALGPSVVCLLMLPNLEPYLQLLEPEMLLEKQKNEVKRHEAWRVFGALLWAAGQCLYDQFKLFPGLLSPPRHPVWRINERIVTMPDDKWKATNDLWSQQPPPKDVASDGTLSSMSLAANVNSSPTMCIDSNMTPSSSSQRVSNEETSGGGSQRETWKKDMDAGHLLASLFELFGEGILPFIPSPEMSYFL